jgi:hypothetical protein
MLRVTPAIEAGVSDHVWTTKDLVDLSDLTQAVAREQSLENQEGMRYADIGMGKA